MRVFHLKQILDAHDMKIDDYRQGAGKFRDLYIGIGKPYETLRKVMRVLGDSGMKSNMIIGHTNNPQHKEAGKPMLEVLSYWWNE